MGGGSMPWSPVPKFPEVMQNLKAKGYTQQVGGETLKVEIIRVLGVTTPKTIGRCLETMSLLGYIRDTGRGFVFDICQGKPGKFKNDAEIKSEDDLDEEELAKKFGV